MSSIHCAHLLKTGWTHTAEDMRNAWGLLLTFVHIVLICAQSFISLMWLMARTRLEEFITFAKHLQILIRNQAIERRISVSAKVFNLVMWSIRYYTMAVVLLIFLTRKASFQLGSILSVQHQSGYMSIMLGFLLEACAMMQVCNYVKITLGFGYVYCVVSSHLLNDLCASVSVSAVGHGRKEAYELIRKYRTLATLCTSFNNTLGQTFVPILKSYFEFAGPILVMICVKMSKGDKSHSSFFLLMIIAGLVVTLAVLELAPILPLAQMYEKSLTVKKLLSAREMTAGKQFRVLHRSCRVLRNQVGQFYFIDCQLILSMINFKVHAIIFLLLNV
jgi:hypothetical protein